MSTVSMKILQKWSTRREAVIVWLGSFTFWPTGYLRLGAMARDKGNFYEASDWFKEALQINQVLRHL